MKKTIGSVVIGLLLLVSVVHKVRKGMELRGGEDVDRVAQGKQEARGAEARARAAERKRAYEAFRATQPAPKNEDEERALQAAFSAKQLEDNRIASERAALDLSLQQARARASLYGDPASPPPAEPASAP